MMAMMKSVLVSALGIRIRNIGLEQVLRQWISGHIDGFQVLDEAPGGQEAGGAP